VQLDPRFDPRFDPGSTALGFSSWKPKYDERPSNFACKFDLRRYIEAGLAAAAAGEKEAGAYTRPLFCST